MTIQNCFISRENNPYVNLSMEEYYLKNKEDDYFILYINSPCVIIGKHQNLVKEINTPWTYKHNINICRRISGGGTVYQDLGNLNFSFIINSLNLEKINYQKFTNPIVQALKNIGIEAENSPRNDLLLKGMKISGNAMHIFKNRVLCHGTLLYNSNLGFLSAALKNNPERYTDKSIRSIPSIVTNISEDLPGRTDVNQFTEVLFRNVLHYLENPIEYKSSESEKAKIIQLSYEKYSTWEWIYSYSPKYIFRNTLLFEGQNIPFEMNVEKGIIKEITSRDKIHFLSKLINRKHDFPSMREFYNSEQIQHLLPQYSADDFSGLFF